MQEIYEKMSKTENYQRLFSAVSRRLVPWVFCSTVVLFSISFITHIVLHSSILPYFQQANLINFLLLELWNFFLAFYVVFQVQNWTGLLTSYRKIHQKFRNFLIAAIYSIFSVFLLSNFFSTSSEKKNLLNWKELTLPLLLTFAISYFYLLCANIRPITTRLIPIHPNFLVTEIIHSLKNIIIKLIFKNLFYIGISCYITKLFVFFFHDILFSTVFPFFTKFNLSSSPSSSIVTFYHVWDEEILTTSTIYKSIIMIIIIQISCEFSISLLYYILTIPLDISKIQTPSLHHHHSNDNEHILMTALTNFPSREENFDREGTPDSFIVKGKEFGKISLKDCLSEYHQLITNTNHVNVNNQNGFGNLSDINLPISLSQFIDQFYQKQLNYHFQIYRSYMNENVAIDETFFPILPILSTIFTDEITFSFQNGVLEIFNLSNILSFHHSFQASFYFMLRCHAWNDMNRLVYSGNYLRRKILYEKHWNTIMNDSSQLITSFLLQVNKINSISSF